MEPQSFADFNLNKQILSAIEELGYTQPSAIQLKCIPVIAAGGQDVLGIAPTGTGKTIPLLKKLSHAQGEHPRVLILVPTRELVKQVEEQFLQLSKNLDLRIVPLYGGVGMKEQIEQIEKGVDVIVATPGRLMDIYLKGELVLKQLKVMVIDEADKMLDMGFLPQLNRILEVIPNKRQNLLFSATFHPKVEKLANDFMLYYLRIEVEQEATPIDLVEQRLYEVRNFKTKLNLLLYLLKNEEMSRVIVFVKTRTNAENVYRFLERREVGEIRVLHANKGQNTRINSMNDFKEGNIRILVSTDVTARGIDVAMVTHVINFDSPLIYDDYVHRIGRTGRAMNKGVAISFANKLDLWHYVKIEKRIRMEIPKLPLPPEVIIADDIEYEIKDMEREIDDLRKKDDPTFQGAFHQKKGKDYIKKFNRSFRKRT
ncbi:MAG: DEAD/DEAH box helicase [Bacteroidetes bacterium]|nr:DEAD/DEAH box helicase [Bacteroidota bacterium]